MTEWFKVGKIVNTHGVRGEVRVISSTDFAEERYAKGTELMIRLEDKEIPVIVAHHRTHKNFDLLQFEGYPSINEVEKFKGSQLFVSGEYLEDLNEGEFYYHEIIGCTVVTEDEEELGIVKEIIETGANDVWVIQRKGGGKDVLIPYIESVVQEVDVEQKKIHIHLLEGLID
ncbi:ribosome maturation factor RimM [Halalkalibacter urbisdiaboli]|uniref:ribosome maturation factor RimM n=1 Tax=Halalkalibacter urbisdiaboli TaxID=1960589 RepID=UPI000B4504BB|nr:ribosome maturation factor RimM [Halalkalibacter urbisdiaboli]